jgi:hypothetical protein
MNRNNLDSWISSKLAQNAPEEIIVQELKNAGWADDDINTNLSLAKNSSKKWFQAVSRFFNYKIPLYVSGAIILMIFIPLVYLSVYVRGGVVSNNISFSSFFSDEPYEVSFQYGSDIRLSNPVFFSKAKEKFLTEKIKFIEADLSSMVLRLYENGTKNGEFPILTKGKEGSWWETPAGLYRIVSKEKNHFSSIGGVYMPWSMAFQGNFFIHGWPYYKNGQPVSSTYSGGCIRLSDEVAKTVFNFADQNTPVLVFEKDFDSDNFQYAIRQPSISAENYLAADLVNNFVFMKKDTGVAPIASLTKLLSAVVATEYIDLDRKIVVPKEALIFTSKPRFKEGDKFSLYQLLFPLLLESSNEAAETISSYFKGSRFVELMNHKAKSIGMNQTTFVDASGVSSQNVATVEDLFMLAKYLLNNRSFILNITTGKLKNSAYGSPIFTDLGNFNDFADDERFLGGKTGKTNAAGETGLYIFKLNIQNVQRPVVIILLNSQDRKKDAQLILNYIQYLY